jgi:hypothetical protein
MVTASLLRIETGVPVTIVRVEGGETPSQRGPCGEPLGNGVRVTGTPVALPGMETPPETTAARRPMGSLQPMR